MLQSKLIQVLQTFSEKELKQFQDLGHQAILVIGDYTATIGDPSNRSSTRPELSTTEVQKNCVTYLDQAFRIIDKDKM